MRNQNTRPSPPKEIEEVKPIDAMKENLCFRCLTPLDEGKKELKGDFYCRKCYEIMKEVYG